jgi:FkbM family methyltransferase
VFEDKGQDLIDTAAKQLLADRRDADGTFTGSLIVDCGANIGATAVHFALGFPGAQIVAIEPEVSNVELMQENVKDFNVICLRAGVSSTAGVGRLVDPRAEQYAFRTTRQENVTDEPTFPFVTINDIYNKFSSFKPLIVKIDIEGAELDLFRENLEWVDATPIITVELHDWHSPGCSETFYKCVNERKRQLFWGKYGSVLAMP